MNDTRLPATFRTWTFLSIATIGMTLLACGIPERMEVRSGIDPRNEDEDVRYRTTYYFRVFDLCPRKAVDTLPSDPSRADSDFANKPEGTYALMTDSLYRFRMTGKGSSLFSEIHFESGTLHRSEIDPFGSAIIFDEKLGRHRYVTQQETQDRAREEAKLQELERLANLYIKLNKLPEMEKDKNVFRDDINAVLRKFLSQVTPSATRQSNSPEQSSAVQCQDGSTAQRGFQILGPEGWRTFNQDERLVLAMATSGKPLISTMRELSARAMNERSSGLEALLLLLTQERQRISNSTRLLEDLAQKGDESAASIVDAVRQEFERQPSQTGAKR